jgi:hypothetical protein
VAGRSKTCCGSDSPSSASLSWARLGRRSVRLTFFFCSANEAGKRRWQDGGSTQQQPARAGEAETGRVARSCFLRGRVWFDVGWWDLVEAVDEWSPAAADCRGGGERVGVGRDGGRGVTLTLTKRGENAGVGSFRRPTGTGVINDVATLGLV